MPTVRADANSLAILMEEPRLSLLTGTQDRSTLPCQGLLCFTWPMMDGCEEEIGFLILTFESPKIHIDHFLPLSSTELWGNCMTT